MPILIVFISDVTPVAPVFEKSSSKPGSAASSHLLLTDQHALNIRGLLRTLSPNGGGDLVNRWTAVMDVKVGISHLYHRLNSELTVFFWCP